MAVRSRRALEKRRERAEQNVARSLLMEETNLYLVDYALEAVPQQVYEAVWVEKLALSKNPLGHFPDQVTVALTNLRQLWLNECLLSDIPPSIGRLQKLEDLSIANNRIERLPDALCTIPALARLDLSGNPIRQLPAALHRLPLDTLGVTGCPLVGITTDGPTRIRGGWEILTAINEHLKVTTASSYWAVMATLCSLSDAASAVPVGHANRRNDIT